MSSIASTYQTLRALYQGERAALTHAQRVSRLYRASLRTLDSWACDKALWNEEATKLRAEFDANKAANAGCVCASAKRRRGGRWGEGARRRALSSPPLPRLACACKVLVVVGLPPSQVADSPAPRPARPPVPRRAAARLLAEGEARLLEWTHPDPYEKPYMPGGSKFMRNPALPLDAVFHSVGGVPEEYNVAPIDVWSIQVTPKRPGYRTVLIDTANKRAVGGS